MAHTFNGTYTGEHLDRIAFPLGGIGAGMICMEGNGGFSHVSLRHRPNVFHQPLIFGAISLRHKGAWRARLLQGRTPDWKVMFPLGKGQRGAGMGGWDTTYGLPFFRECRFRASFPFAEVELSDANMPVRARLVGWSPFSPGNADDSSLPLGVVEYLFTNESGEAVDGVFTFAAEHFIRHDGTTGCCDRSTPVSDHEILTRKNGFLLRQPRGEGPAHREGSFAVLATEEARVNGRWFRGGWFDAMTVLWKDIAEGRAPQQPPAREGDPGRGASLAVSFALAPGETRSIRLLLAWHVPFSDLRVGGPPAESTPETSYRPWYAERFADVDAVLDYARSNLYRLKGDAERFRNDLRASPLPPEALEAVDANLSILKSPTVLRQYDGRIWAWEGCCDDDGCCAGSCTHVWNYAQALAHLFPDLERSLRKTEFTENQDERGHQNFRAWLPIRPTDHGHHAAADGQLGGIMKVHRDWSICGDYPWLRSLWPRVKQSLAYCIQTWDPDRIGLLTAPHHNTYDIEFWGPDGMCTSFYLGALKAATRMASALGESGDEYETLYRTGRAAMESRLWNGEYFVQIIQAAPGIWEAQGASPDGATAGLSPEAQSLFEREGPKYQYGEGCLADGVLGAWMAAVCGVGDILDRDKVKRHLQAVFRHNFRESLHDHVNPQRPTYALNDESGLLLCTWPRGGRLTLPFPYSEEVWTGIEYQVASHLILLGERGMGETIVRAVRRRYDGRVRNPFNEYECGHWYARALASFALLQAYDVETSWRP